jgi:phosphoacetylglucosamine mutase
MGSKKPSSLLQVDCANGVGAVALEQLIKSIGEDSILVKITNNDVISRGVLNFDCGADYVKMYQKPPKDVSLANSVRACSLDGDADRIVFYFMQDGTFRLLDGDKIATLAAGFIMQKIKEAKVTHTDKSPLKVGLVQTAYANGSSTSYVKDVLKVPVVFTPTGVKHLHHEAAHFDVGVYFEANGHGTVLFSDKAIATFKSTKG